MCVCLCHEITHADARVLCVGKPLLLPIAWHLGQNLTFLDITGRFLHSSRVPDPLPALLVSCS